MKFSIVTISYNQAKFLEQAILSIINQNYENWEYIVVDPGSTDGSRDIIERYRSKISKILYEPDCGPADGLNKGFSHATGDIFGFINADDELIPGALKKLADHFEKYPQTDVVSGCGFFTDTAGAATKRIIPTRFSKKLAVYGAVTFFQQGTFFRNSAFYSTKGFNIENRSCWDGELILDMAINGKQFDILHEDIANFRIHESSISGSGKLIDLYKNDCNRLFIKVMNREMNSMDKLLMRLFRLEKWLMNPKAIFLRIRWPKRTIK